MCLCTLKRPILKKELWKATLIIVQILPSGSDGRIQMARITKTFGDSIDCVCFKCSTKLLATTVAPTLTTCIRGTCASYAGGTGAEHKRQFIIILWCNWSESVSFNYASCWCSSISTWIFLISLATMATCCFFNSKESVHQVLSVVSGDEHRNEDLRYCHTCILCFVDANAYSIHLEVHSIRFEFTYSICNEQLMGLWEFALHYLHKHPDQRQGVTQCEAMSNNDCIMVSTSGKMSNTSNKPSNKWNLFVFEKYSSSICVFCNIWWHSKIILSYWSSYNVFQFIYLKCVVRVANWSVNIYEYFNFCKLKFSWKQGCES